jgi:hypothetical protein
VLLLVFQKFIRSSSPYASVVASINVAELTSPALPEGGGVTMRHIALVLTVALLMGTMLVASALPVMASNGADASGGAACNQGTEHAHEVGVKTDAAHANIPECD